MTSLVGSATTLQGLTQGFVQRVSEVAKADGAALRWSDETNERYLMLASEGLPQSMLEAEHCVRAGDCHCGTSGSSTAVRVIPIGEANPARLPHCRRAGFETIVSVPIRLHERLMGEVDLFFHAQCDVTAPERSLLEALTAHLAAAMDNIRLLSLEKEAAVSQERSFIARELHDSIAQSLAFLKIQVQLMQDALDQRNPQQAQSVLQEIDAGVRESYADVRELLVHFRTRASAEDIEPALQTTLRKFEQQTGIPATLHMQGNALPLAPDLQIQVLHILQEALSNVRKHAGATQVWLNVRQQPLWRFEVRDDGAGEVQRRALDGGVAGAAGTCRTCPHDRRRHPRLFRCGDRRAPCTGGAGAVSCGAGERDPRRRAHAGDHHGRTADHRAPTDRGLVGTHQAAAQTDCKRA